MFELTKEEYDKQFTVVFDTLKKLIVQEEKPKRKMDLSRMDSI